MQKVKEEEVKQKWSSLTPQSMAKARHQMMTGINVLLNCGLIHLLTQ
tara:strand:- start:278 stop:418 length:141 start_codon:yes stop_codon:yes gene_type:complete